MNRINIKKYKAFSMIEVIVTLFIVSVSFVVLSDLHRWLQRAHFDAHQRLSAALKIEELANRIHTNPYKLDKYWYHRNNAVTQSNNPCAAGQVACADIACSGENAALYDLAELFCHRKTIRPQLTFECKLGHTTDTCTEDTHRVAIRMEWEAMSEVDNNTTTGKKDFIELDIYTLK